MRTIFRGSAALACGDLSRGRLRSSYRTLYPDVYMPQVGRPSLYSNTMGAWLWSRERGVIAGRAAAALHGTTCVDDDAPIELLWNNTHPPSGIIARNERFTCDEVVEIYGMAVTSIQRTAFDLGRHLERGSAVAHLDSLAAATGLAAEHVLPLVELYKGARGMRRLREVLDLMDPGSQSPKESWVRLVLMDAGFPRPQTQIPVLDDYGDPFAWLDMGWRDRMIAVEYDGKHHQSNRRQYVWDARRLGLVQRRGWLHIRVIAEDRPYDIIDRVRRAWAQRETEGRVA